MSAPSTSARCQPYVSTFVGGRSDRWIATNEMIKLDISVSKCAASVKIANEPEYSPPSNSERKKVIYTLLQKAPG